MTSDWLCPVTQGGWWAAPPVTARCGADVSLLGCGLYKSGAGGWLAFGCWSSPGQHVSLYVWWRVSCCGVLFICCQDFGLLRCHSSAVMDTPDYGSPVRTYVHNYNSMRKSHDADSSEPQGLLSLGVVDLDLSP